MPIPLKLSARRARKAVRDQDALLVCVAPDEAFADLAIDGAIPRSRFDALAAADKVARPLIFYAPEDSAAAGLAQVVLDVHPQANVAVLEGGKESWLREVPPATDPFGGAELVSPGEAHRRRLDGAMLVCAYEELARYQSCQVAGCISRGTFEGLASQLASDSWLIFYDDDPGAVTALELAAKARDELGFARVAVLDGGYQAWRKAGLPEPEDTRV